MYLASYEAEHEQDYFVKLGFNTVFICLGLICRTGVKPEFKDEKSITNLHVGRESRVQVYRLFFVGKISIKRLFFL